MTQALLKSISRLKLTELAQEKIRELDAVERVEGIYPHSQKRAVKIFSANSEKVLFKRAGTTMCQIADELPIETKTHRLENVIK